MKALFFCQNNTLIDQLMPALRLSWPNFIPMVVNQGTTGIGVMKQEDLDIVFACEDTLDLNIWSVISNIREFSDVPIMLISDANDDLAIMKGLELGADAYIGIPIKPMASVARISALLRRVGQGMGKAGEEMIKLDAMRLNPNNFEVYLEKERVILTDTEFRLLHLLVKNKYTALSQDFIQSALWSDDTVQKHSIKKYIQRLRHKLGDDAKNPTWIQTVRGVGYRFNMTSPEIRESISVS